MIVILANQLTESLRFCTECGKPLSGKVALLEFNHRTSTYHDYGDVPAEFSQGGFSFGIACARRRISKKERS